MAAVFSLMKQWKNILFFYGVTLFMFSIWERFMMSFINSFFVLLVEFWKILRWKDNNIMTALYAVIMRWFSRPRWKLKVNDNGWWLWDARMRCVAHEFQQNQNHGCSQNFRSPGLPLRKHNSCFPWCLKLKD